MNDFYSRVGERRSINTIEQKESGWIPLVGGAVIAIMLVAAIIFNL